MAPHHEIARVTPLMNQFGPERLRVLVVDSKTASRISAVQLLRDCLYQVKSQWPRVNFNLMHVIARAYYRPAHHANDVS